jgi:membrane dipeptidase
MGIVIDAHSDTLLFVSRGMYHLNDDSADAQVDIPKLRTGRVTAQVIALYVESAYQRAPAHRTCELIDLAYSECAAARSAMLIATSAAEVRAAKTTNQIALLLSIEGGEALEGSLAMLRSYYRLGVRLLGLTHNPRNLLADGLDASATPGGLTPFGRDVVTEMERLGIVVDVSHLAEPGFWEVMAMATRPVIASHSKVRAVGHPRGLSDEQIVALARTEGMLGVNLYRLRELDAIVEQIDHVRQLVGSDFVGLGLDFYGRAEAPRDLQDVSQLPRLSERLQQRGYPSSEIDNIMGENFLRVFGAVTG